MRDAELIVEADGEIRFVYDDELAEIVRSVGPLEIRRASHVEPSVLKGGDAGWWANLRPVRGGIFGPFGARAAALDFEVAWLRDHDIPFPAAS